MIMINLLAEAAFFKRNSSKGLFFDGAMGQLKEDQAGLLWTHRKSY